MKALVYRGSGRLGLEDRPEPRLLDPTDALVRVTMTMICAKDLEILNGDVPSCAPGRILGHEGLGVVEAVGASVRSFRSGDRVLISCISACGACGYCARFMYSQCPCGGWTLGNRIDGTQAEFVRIPFADTSLYPVPGGVDEEGLVMLSDGLPTGFACGALKDRIHRGSSIAIVGAGPVGLAALVAAQFADPSRIIVIDPDESRLAVARRFGATATLNRAVSDLAAAVLGMTGARGVDMAIDATGLLDTFELCEAILAVDGSIAGISESGARVALHLENLWDPAAAITSRCIDSLRMPMLLDVLRSRRIDPRLLNGERSKITHRFTLDRILDGYDAMAQGRTAGSPRVLIQAQV